MLHLAGFDFLRPVPISEVGTAGPSRPAEGPPPARTCRRHVPAIFSQGHADRASAAARLRQSFAAASEAYLPNLVTTKFSFLELADICVKMGIMDTDFIEKTIRSYAQTLKGGNQAEQEASEDLVRIADKLRKKRHAEKAEIKPISSHVSGGNRPTSSL